MTTGASESTKSTMLGIAGWIGAAIAVLPLVYLTSLALLVSASVHGYRVPLSVITNYAKPSNAMARVPGVKSISQRYLNWCLRLTNSEEPKPRE